MVNFTDMTVEYIDHMGSDLSVVNAARVSFDKRSEVLTEKDKKLIAYLANHNHWTPFGHTSLCLKFKAPIFVARQLGKHQVGLVWNEVSRRYVDSDPEFFESPTWRARAENVKQGSDEAKEIGFIESHGNTREMYEKLTAYTFDIYKSFLDAGVCPEQARMVLPQSMMTEWYWTGSLAAWARVLKLRLDPHTQKETRDVAAMTLPIVEHYFPISAAALLK
jgi:thymidylate synthase (FAD)